MRIAYADPPYPGMSRFYKEHPDYGGEVDHRELIEQLVAEYPEGWALSTSSTSLRELLPLCPADVRVAAWVKPFCAFKKNVRVAYTWEPVILSLAGRDRGDWRVRETVRDHVSSPMEMRRGLTGAKPESFCFWLFEVLGLSPGDELVDLFPGTGGVTRAWEKWQRQLFAPRFPDGSPDVGLCPLCDGSGLWKNRMCQACSGSGRTSEVA